MLLLDENQKNNIKTTDVNYITDWDKEGTEVEQVAGFIRKQSEYGDGHVHLTSRQSVEIPFIKLENIEEVIEKLF